jgi:hypothetical protein
MSRRVSVALALLVGVAVVGALVAARNHEAKGLKGAIALTADDSHFASAAGASATLVKITELLFAEGRTCRGQGAATAATPACQGRFAAGGFAQVAAVAVRDCGAPAIFEVRTGFLRYLRAIRDLEQSARAPLPDPPTIPPC